MQSWEFIDWLRAKDQLIRELKYREKSVEEIVNEFFKRYVFEVSIETVDHRYELEALAMEHNQQIQEWKKQRALTKLTDAILQEELFSAEEIHEKTVVRTHYRILIFAAPKLGVVPHPKKVL